MPKVTPEYERFRRERIVEGAAKIFAESDYRQTRMGQICNSLKISKGILYIYFKNKEELFISTMDDIFQKRYAHLSQGYDETDALPVRFAKMLDRISSLVGSEEL